MHSKLSTLLIAAMLWQGAAFAQSPAPKADEPGSAELAKAREELQRAAQHLAELTREAGMDGERMRIEMRNIRGNRPVIGIIMAEGGPGEITLAGVTPESPAAKAGLRAGDAVTAINGHKITGDSARARVVKARELIGGLKPGDEVALTYRREKRDTTVKLKAEPMAGVMVWHGAGPAFAPHGDMDGMREFHGIIDPEVEMEIARIAPMAGCQDDPQHCRFTRLSQAFRWSGLSLAELNPGLGRYFGSERGVLVLRDGKEGLDALKAGDVIVSIDGTAVDDPRSAMRALRGRDAGSKVTLDILRDKRAQSVQVTAPELRSIELFAPPAPPAAPAAPAPPVAPTAPTAPTKGGSAMRAPHPALPPVPAPPAPPAPPSEVEIDAMTHVVFVSDDADAMDAPAADSRIY